jgi:hypothetical protein
MDPLSILVIAGAFSLGLGIGMTTQILEHLGIGPQFPDDFGKRAVIMLWGGKEWVVESVREDINTGQKVYRLYDKESNGVPKIRAFSRPPIGAKFYSYWGDK